MKYHIDTIATDMLRLTKVHIRPIKLGRQTTTKACLLTEQYCSAKLYRFKRPSDMVSVPFII